MKGQQRLSWLFDWIGEGAQGRNYELIEAVQPVVNVDGFEFPLEWQCWQSAAINVVNGTVTTALPVPPARKSRLWIEVWVQSTAATAPEDWIDRVINGAPFAIIGQIQSTLALRQMPLIGGQIMVSATSDAQRGYTPQVANAFSALQHRHIDTAAAGTFTLRGCFIDLPLAAPFAARYLS